MRAEVAGWIISLGIRETKFQFGDKVRDWKFLILNFETVSETIELIKTMIESETIGKTLD